jgi:hypothetical protein
MPFQANDFKRELTLLVNKAKAGGTSESEIIELLEDASEMVGEGDPRNPPRNIHAPYVSGDSQVGSILLSTQGEWDGSPTSYSYQWKRGSTNIGIDDSEYTIVVGDSGSSIGCTVTATNANGSTVAPPSNTVAIP